RAGGGPARAGRGAMPDMARCAARPGRRNCARHGDSHPAAGNRPRIAGARESQEEPMNWRALVAEAAGTFVLVGMGSLGVASALLFGGQDFGLPLILMVVPVCVGLGLLSAIAIFGEVSGGHFNPAVTLAAVLDRRLRWTDSTAYAGAHAVR